MSADPSPSFVAAAPIVAVAGWLVPGSGYWLIGQRTRGTVIGVSVLALFILGLLIGGVRVIEVPGYSAETGQRRIDPATRLWVLQVAPLNEVRDKPWSLPQVMTGPVAVAAGAWSVSAARDNSGALTHARINEIGSLYLSVAGLLNLMAIIDATHRSVHLAERRRSAVTTAGVAA